jgi:hypothetical protein
MQDQNQPLQTLEDIKQMMDKSSRFISLSGWSGVAAGACALVASFVTADRIACAKTGDCLSSPVVAASDASIQPTLITIALVTFVVAAALAFFFTYLRSRKTGVAIWGYTARKLMLNVAVPMLVGGLLIWRMMQFHFYGLIAPACLLFYGLALVNASKFTVPEIRYLGYLQLLLGILNLWMLPYGLYFWAAGFGILHILYGILMWNKYERNQ